MKTYKKRLLAILLLLVVVAGLGLGWAGYLAGQLDSRIAHLRSEGFPVAGADLNDAAALASPGEGELALRSALESVAALELVEGSAAESWPQALRGSPIEWDEDKRAISAGVAEEAAETLASLEAALDDEGAILHVDMSQNLAARPESRYASRRAANLLLHAALRHAAQPGGTQASVAATRRGLRLGSAIESNFMFTGMVSVAITGVALNGLEGSISTPAYDAAVAREVLEPLLAAAEQPDRLERCFVGERAIFLGAVESLRSGKNLEAVPGYSPGWIRRRLLLPLDALRATDCFAVCTESCSLPSARYEKRLTELMEEINLLPRFFYPLTRIQLPGGMRARTACDHLGARLRLARLALAAKLHRAETGEWPASAAALAPHFPAGVPVDPYEGKEFVLEPTETGLTLRVSLQDERYAIDTWKLLDR